MSKDLVSENLDTVGARLRAERNAQKISRKHICDATGIAYSTLAEIENEGQKSSTKLHDIANAFPRRLRVEWLADGELPRYADDSAAPRRMSMDRAYFAITVGEFNALDDENRRDVEALLRSIREAVKRSAKRQSLKPARKSGK